MADPTISDSVDEFEPVNSLVIISNPNLLRHKYCIGVVLTSMTVVTAKECAGRGVGTVIQIYEKPEDVRHEGAESYTVSLIGDDFSGLNGVAQLYLEKPLENKNPALFMLPELTGDDPLFFYYLAVHQSKLIIKMRQASKKDSTLSPDSKFSIFVPEDWELVIDDFIYGAVLFDNEKRVIGVSFDEMSLYSLLGGDAVFHRVALDDHWSSYNDEL